MNINEVETGMIDCEWRQGFKDKLSQGTFKEEDIDFLIDSIFDLKEKLEASEAVIDCFYEATKKVGW